MPHIHLHRAPCWAVGVVLSLTALPAAAQSRAVYPQAQVYAYPPAPATYFTPYQPWPYSARVFGVPYWAPVENPTGHTITWTGPNSYIYAPVYGPGLDRAEPLAKAGRQVYGLAAVADLGVAPIEPPAKPVADQLLGYAVRDFYLANYQAVIQTLGRLEVENPAHAGADLLRVPTYLGLGRYDRAAERLMRITETQPAAAWGLVFQNAREFYHRPADLASHLEAAEELVGRGEASPDVYLVLGYAYSYLGQPERGLQHLARAERTAADLGLLRMADAAARLRIAFRPESEVPRAAPPAAAPVAPPAPPPAGPREF
jgi:hypothetical protein